MKWRKGKRSDVGWVPGKPRPARRPDKVGLFASKLARRLLVGLRIA